MKKIIQNTFKFTIFLGVLFAVVSPIPAFAQLEWYDESPSTYQYNYGSYTNPNIDTVSTECIGCGTQVSNQSGLQWYDESPSTYQYNYGSYTNPNIDTVSTECYGCGNAYTAPVYTSPTYTTPAYTAPVYTSPTYTNPVYTTPSYTYPTYSNSGYIYPTYTAPVYTAPIPTNNTTVCSDGQLPSPTTGCNRTTTIPVTNNTVCADGFATTNGLCIRTNTIPVTNTTICSDGLLPTNGSCVRTQVIPSQTISYQTCWDGSRAPFSQVCPSQYKYCANGTSVPIYQACYVNTTPQYVPAPVVAFNNVVTSVVTQITNTSGRCNGIGLIASNAPSVGWFEYGETSSLGRTTGSANIGSSYNAPFSNVLANLKPSTKYFCRAVMQNKHGVVKGEIVGFTTKAKVVTYVKPIAHTTKKPVVTKAPTKKNEVLCADGTTVSVKSKSSAALLNAGQKLISLNLEKGEGKLVSQAVVGYKVTYKNVGDARLTGVIIKMTLPQELTYVSSTAGTYDEASRTLIINQDSLDPYTEGVILVTGKVINNAPVGKSVVANVYIAYTVPGTDTQDEVTAYAVSSIVPETNISKVDTGAKKVIGLDSGRGFMPDSLIEWLALLAILFIVFILGRSIYASYNENERGERH